MNDNQDPSQIETNVTPNLEQIPAPMSQETQVFGAVKAETPTGVTTSGVTIPSAVMSAPVPLQRPFPTSTKAPKKGKKGLIVGVTIAIFGLGLIGSGAWAYTVYQEPENVLLGAASNMLSLQKFRTKTVVTSDVSYGTGDERLSLEQLTFESGMERLPRADTNAELKVLYGEKHIALRADVLVTEAGELYFRVSNAKDTIKKALGDSAMMSVAAESIIDKIDSKWAKYTIADLKADNPEYGKVAQCTLDVYKKHKDDSNVTKELVDVYKANEFVVIDGEPQDKVSQVGYTVKIDNKKLVAYSKAAESTSVAKELRACDGSKAPLADENDDSDTGVDAPYAENTDSDSPTTVTTFWITKFSHKLRAIDVRVTYPEGVEGKPVSITTHTDILDDQGVTTTVPSGAMAAKQWSEHTQEFYSEMIGGEATVRAEDSSMRAKAFEVAKKAEAYYAITAGYPNTVADFAKYPETILADASMVVATLPTDPSRIAYKKCKDMGAQVVYKQSDGTFIANNLGRIGGNSTAVTALCP